MFATEFFANFHENVQVDGEAPELPFHETGYLFLATEDGMENLITNHEIQKNCGAEVALLNPKEISERDRRPEEYNIDSDFRSPSAGTEEDEETLRVARASGIFSAANRENSLNFAQASLTHGTQRDTFTS